MKSLVTLLTGLIATFTTMAQGVESISPASNTVQSTNPNTVSNDLAAADNTIYQFKVEGLDGDNIDFAKFAGKKILVVNTASKCGYTPQYKELQALYDQFKEKLVIIGFPANNFGGQEPGTNTEIKEFCAKNFGVTFPMAAKISVKGEDAAPIYKWLCTQAMNGVMDVEVKWNFGKFLINEKGILVSYFPSKVNPMSDELLARVKE